MRGLSKDEAENLFLQVVITDEERESFKEELKLAEGREDLEEMA